MRLWNGDSGDCETTLTGHKSAVTALRYSRSGALLGSGELGVTHHSGHCTLLLLATQGAPVSWRCCPAEWVASAPVVLIIGACPASVHAA